MRAAWRLATNSLSARAGRSALLALAIALSTALIAVVACAMASINHALEAQVTAQIGTADLRLEPISRTAWLTDDDEALVRAWPEVASVTPRLVESVLVRARRTIWVPESSDPDAPPDGPHVRASREIASTALCVAFRAADFAGPSAPQLAEGRWPEAPNEIVLDQKLALRFTRPDATTAWAGAQSIFSPATSLPVDAVEGASEAISARDARARNLASPIRIGERVELVRLLRAPTPLTIVGIAARPPLEGRPQCYMTIEGLSAFVGRTGRLSDVGITLVEGTDAEAVAQTRRSDLAPGRMLATTAKVTSGLERNMRSSQLGFILATLLTVLSASFIIMTGLNTDLAQRQRQLATLRCIGASRPQLAWAQLIHGGLLGVFGALVGVPLGILMALGLTRAFHEQLSTGLVLPTRALLIAGVAAVAAGLLGAAWPAWRATRTSPLLALTQRAAPPSVRGVVALLVAGLVLLALHMAIVTIPRDGQVVFWGYATIGLPAMFVGYFLLSVPLCVLIARPIAPVLTRVLALPPRLLARTLGVTPYRHGFTAGALMTGMAMLVSIWVNGGALLRDYVHRFDFPDAFVTGLNLTDQSQRDLESMTGVVTRTCAITLYPVETEAFGVRALQKYKTTFIAFEPDRFFEMANLTWVQGTLEEALPRLRAGGAVIVAREFLIAKGLGVGDTLDLTANGRTHSFDIVGVVTSPGLDVLSKFFNVGEDYLQQAIHAVFGSRDDLRNRFGIDAINMIQIDLAEGVDDEVALEGIRQKLLPAGVLDAGSGRLVKQQLTSVIGGTLLVFSAVAVVAMLVACLGVANLVIASIHERRFEMGVLRAVGASRSLLARLVLAEVVIIALTACVLGTMLGMQGGYSGWRLNRMLLGLATSLTFPAIPVALGCLTMVTLTLAAAAPAVMALARRRTRELLAAGR
ncbi:MAG: ABC transporter permease [Phycisphaerales bacterium]|jgi:putative ABC transport system permease protein|nr:ABC transporter permease [Phycisphaerales bacterium]